jgi:hypothetical protein
MPGMDLAPRLWCVSNSCLTPLINTGYWYYRLPIGNDRYPPARKSVRGVLGAIGATVRRRRSSTQAITPASLKLK